MRYLCTIWTLFNAFCLFRIAHATIVGRHFSTIFQNYYHPDVKWKTDSNFIWFSFCSNRRSVLEQQRSNGLDYMGPIKPSLAICVFVVFVLVYFSLWKGVRSAGKVVWVTALAPYVVLIFLLIRGVTLPGAAEGIRYYLTPQWHKLKSSKVRWFLSTALNSHISLINDIH